MQRVLVAPRGQVARSAARCRCGRRCTTRSARPWCGAGDDRVPEALHLEVVAAPQRRLDGVGDLLLVAAHRLDVDEVLGRAARRPRPDQVTWAASDQPTRPARGGCPSVALTGDRHRCPDRTDPCARPRPGATASRRTPAPRARAACSTRWYPSPRLGAPDQELEAPPSWPGSRASTRSAGCAGCWSAPSSRTCRRRPPTPPTCGCGCTCSATGWSRPHAVNLDGHLRQAHQRGVDRPRPVRGRGLREHPAAADRGARPGHGPRRGQVPADDRLRPPDGRPDRRRRPGAPRRPPRRRHHRHARGLRQLQRRHARRLHGRGPDQRRGRGRRRLRRRRRRVDHGHPLRRRQGRDLRRPSAA